MIIHMNMKFNHVFPCYQFILGCPFLFQMHESYEPIFIAISIMNVFYFPYIFPED